MFEEHDAAVVLAWHESDAENEEFPVHRLVERQRNAGRAVEVFDAVVHRADTASDRRIARA